MATTPLSMGRSLDHDTPDEVRIDTVTHEVAFEILKTLWATRTPAVLVGEPGIGKTALAKQLAQWISAEVGQPCTYLDPNMVCRDSVDFTGVPVPDGKGGATWTRPAFLPGDDGYYVLCLDELMAAARLTQQTASSVMLERAAGGHKLGPNVYVIATGNLPKHKAGADTLLSHLRSRACIMELIHTTEGFCAWAAENDLEEEVIAFSRFRSDLLQAFNPDVRSYPCLRAWAAVSNNLRTIKARGGIAPQAELMLYAGLVGYAAATEFRGFISNFRLIPDLAECLAHPDTAPVPDIRQANGAAIMFALTAALAKRVTEKTIGNFLKYVKRIPHEYAEYAVRDAIRRNPKLTEDNAYMVWAAQNKDLIVLS